jgi:oxygen-independent coproporphyrinogen-3 oxidase
LDGLHAYVHVPFCRRKCRYCGFFSLPVDEAADRDLLDRYVEALSREAMLRAREAVGFDRWSTIYFGGGTPALLGPARIGRFLAALASIVPIPAGAEVTLEANPGCVGEGDLPRYLELGIRRLSIGLQSLDDGRLAWLGRTHSAQEGTRLAELSLASGLATSIDLIYGTPGQTTREWQDELRRAASLGAEHISAYALTLEEGTPLHADVLAGRVTLPPEELAAELFCATHEALRAAGYEAYEVSNFARSPSARSLHNLAYWRMAPYVGLGPAAHSFDGRVRRWNLADLQGYLRSLEEAAAGDPAGGGAARVGTPPRDSETLTDEQLLLEYVMLGMRQPSGIEIRRGLEMTGVDLARRCDARARELELDGLLVLDRERWRPTPAGLLLADALPLLLLEAPPEN